MRILLLCDYRPFNAATVCAHINAFYRLSVHDIFIYSNLVKNQGRLPEEIDLNEFDAVVVHYSIFLAIDAFISPRSRNRLKKYRGVKVIFIQDEYRFVNATVHHLKNIGFDLLFTCVPKKEIEKVYPKEKLHGLKKINTLTGYVPESLLLYKAIPLKKRKYHVSYRGRKYPAWHGRLGLEKWQIAERFKREARCHGLKVNISWKENKRLYGSDWTKLIQNSRAVLGVESGSSVFDFTGEIDAKVKTITALLGEEYIKKNGILLSYFKDKEDNIQLAQISPRIFEAIALRTLCILYEGEYSGILEPWKHYIPLKKDHSNMDQLVKILKNDERVAEIITNAFGEIAVNERYSFNTLIRQFDVEVGKIYASKSSVSKSKKVDFPDPGSFYTTFPFFPIFDPYGLSIPGRSKLLSSLVPKIPDRLKKYIKRLLNQ